MMNGKSLAFLVKGIQHLPPTIHKIIVVDFCKMQKLQVIQFLTRRKETMGQRIVVQDDG